MKLKGALASAASFADRRDSRCSKCRPCSSRPDFQICFLLLACLAMTLQNASAILDGGLGLSVDQLIDASRGDYVIDTGMPSTPQESRAIWENESKINFNLTESLDEIESSSQSQNSDGKGQVIIAESTSSATSIKASNADAGTDSNVQSDTMSSTASSINLNERRISEDSGQNAIEAAATSSNSSASDLAAATDASNQSSLSASDISGNWTFRLKDSGTAVMALSLYQSDGVIFGSGSINDGGDSQRTQASGSIKDGNMSLDVTTSGEMRLYRLSLSGDVNSVSGSYQAYSLTGLFWRGTASGEKKQI